MQEVDQALEQVQSLFEKVVGKPAPDVRPDSYLPFPPGVDPREHAVQEVRQLQRLTEQMAFAPSPLAWIPPADCLASERKFVVRMEIPGVPREDLKVLCAGNECIVRGERKATATDPELRVLSVERPVGPFERRFTLPPDCGHDAVEARYEDGVLELHVALTEPTPARETKVEVARSR